MGERCRGSVKAKVLVGVAVVALCVAPVASAKFKMWLTVGDSTPRIGQSVTVVLRAERNLDYDLKLIAGVGGCSRPPPFSGLRSLLGFPALNDACLGSQEGRGRGVVRGCPEPAGARAATDGAGRHPARVRRRGRGRPQRSGTDSSTFAHAPVGATPSRSRAAWTIW